MSHTVIGGCGPYVLSSPHLTPEDGASEVRETQLTPGPVVITEQQLAQVPEAAEMAHGVSYI